MTEFIEALMWFVLGGIILPWARDWWKNPYRYYCPEEDCYFAMRSNNKPLIDETKADHIKNHERKKLLTEGE
jgi:hypothetical protein